MKQKIINAWVMQCGCCDHPLVAQEGNEEGPTQNAPEFYRIFLKKEDAEAEANQYGAKIMPIDLVFDIKS